MASINPYAGEKEHVLFVYDASIAFQIHFCLTIIKASPPLCNNKEHSLWFANSL